MSKELKKNSFIEGTILSYLAIIVTKVLGMVYTIPFKGIIGVEGGAIYGIAYNIYSLFLNISTSGIPTALSIIISEYLALNMLKSKEKAYRLGQKVVFLISFVSFLILFVFAKPIGQFFIASGENTVSAADVAVSIRVVALCLLIVPFLSVRRGYLQGHKFITVSSYSQVIEQFVRIFVVLVGSYIIVNVLHLGISLGVACALFGAFLGAFVTFLYLERVIHKNRKSFLHPTISDSEEEVGEYLDDDVASSILLKNLLTHSLAIVIVSISTNIYELTDMKLVMIGLSNIGYNGTDTQYIASLISTWGPKICMLITALAVSMCYSIIPHISEYFVHRDYEGMNRQFNQAVNTVLLITIPMAAAICMLAKPVFHFFYPGEVDIAYGPELLPYLAVAYVINSIFMISTMALQTISKTRLVCLASIAGFIVNAVLDIPMIYLFNQLGFMPHVATTVARYFGELASLGMIFYYLKKDLEFHYKNIFTTFVKIIVPVIAMVLVLFGLNFVLPETSNYIVNIVHLGIYGVFGVATYAALTYANGVLADVLGKEFIDNIFGKILRILKR